MRKILIVDDSQAEARLIQAVLKDAGYWPVAVHEPSRVEQMIEVERPVLILLDVVMPNRNGFQVCRELKNHAEYSRIPVVMVTSKNTPSDRFWAEQQGADAFIGKPFSREELLKTVERFV